MLVFHGGFLCTSACRCMFLCIVVWGCRQNWVTWGRFFVRCVCIYGKTQVICDHLVIHVHTNKVFEESAVFLYLIDAGVRGDRVHETDQVEGVCSVMNLEEDRIRINHAVNDISEDFPPWGLELRSSSCVLDLVSTISNVFGRWS